MTYSNMPHSIVIVGVLFISAIALIRHVDNFIFWFAIALAFILAMWTWIRLDSDVNNEEKRLILEKMELENDKLELENKKLELGNEIADKYKTFLEEVKK